MEEYRDETKDMEEKEEREDIREYVERKRLLFFGLPFTFTKYKVNERVITINSGLLNTTENDCYLYKVQDVELSASLGERIFGMGTIICYTGDTTNPKLYIEHVRNAKAIKDFILEASEEARMKRRTMNTLSIDADVDLDGNGIPDRLED